MGLISRTVESLEDSLSLLGEIIATFEVNKSRLKWTEEEFKALYKMYEQRWKPKYDRIRGVEITVESESKGGA